MNKLLPALIVVLGLAGCESTPVRLEPDSPNPAYRLNDDPAVDRAQENAPHTNPTPPVSPADVDTGGGSGTR